MRGRGGEIEWHVRLAPSIERQLRSVVLVPLLAINPAREIGTTDCLYSLFIGFLTHCS